jgi:phosphoribosyl-AMP cyclohydrolase
MFKADWRFGTNLHGLSLAIYRHRYAGASSRRSAGAERFSRPMTIEASLMQTTSPFAAPGSAEEVEEGRALAPRFDADGLVTCVATDARSGEVLMVAHMNAEALRQTIATGEAWYYSRSRQALWRKGSSSGHVQRVVEMRVDCDQDAVWIRVEQQGAGACHTGRRSCFYRAVALGKTGAALLEFRDADRTFDPKAVYRK